MQRLLLPLKHSDRSGPLGVGALSCPSFEPLRPALPYTCLLLVAIVQITAANRPAYRLRQNTLSDTTCFSPANAYVEYSSSHSSSHDGQIGQQEHGP